MHSGWKICEIRQKFQFMSETVVHSNLILLWITNRKSQVADRSASVPSTLSDLKRREARCQISRRISVSTPVPDDLQETVMNDFIKALRWSDQDHVANIFRRESDVLPLSDEHYNIIVQKRPSLCRYMIPSDQVVDHLFLSGVFSDTDRAAVLSKPQIDDMAQETSSILLRNSDSCFDTLVRALEDSGQSHVVTWLTC